VGGHGDGSAGERGGQLFKGREAGGGLKGEERGDGDADEGVECVPEEVKGGDFVGEELQGEEGAGCACLLYTSVQ